MVKKVVKISEISKSDNFTLFDAINYCYNEQKNGKNKVVLQFKPDSLIYNYLPTTIYVDINEMCKHIQKIKKWQARGQNNVQLEIPIRSVDPDHIRTCEKDNSDMLADEDRKFITFDMAKDIGTSENTIVLTLFSKTQESFNCKQ